VVAKVSRRPGARTSKVYLVGFMCMSTKAVCLELVTDVLTDVFLATLDRFVARRGTPVNLFTDCGTNYVGTAKQLKKLFDVVHNQSALANHVHFYWCFDPPGAPHFGGIWEAAIKSSKTHMKKVIGIQLYTIKGLTTVFVRIKCV